MHKMHKSEDSLQTRKFRGSLPESVDTVWTAILDLGVGLGDRLPTEMQLAAKLKVSRPKLREALMFLEFLGLVHRYRGGGTYIASMDSISRGRQVRTLLSMTLELIASDKRGRGRQLEVLDPVREARASIEGAVAFQCTLHRTPNDLVQMESSIDDIENLIRMAKKTPSKNYDDAFLEADKAFHESVLRGAHNPFLTVFGEIIVHFFATAKPQSGPERAAKVIAEHREIFQEIRGHRSTNKDDVLQCARCAQELMYLHIINPHENMKSFTWPQL